MDYRLNNEALIACIITEILYRKSVDMLQLSIAVTYLINESNDRCFGDKYKECLPVVMNAALILKESECIEVSNGIIVLTDSGVGLHDCFSNGMSKRFAEIISRLDFHKSYLLDSTNVQLIESLKFIIAP